MANLLRRVHKLEQHIAGHGGSVPGTPQWLAYWTEQIDKIFSGEDPGPPGCIPLAVVDAVLGAPTQGD